MDAADRKLVWDDMLKRARAAGFVQFDGDGVAVLVLDDAEKKPATKSRRDPAGDALPGLQGRQGGDGQGQGPQ